jgi:hypothetical protein
MPCYDLEEEHCSQALRIVIVAVGADGAGHAGGRTTVALATAYRPKKR